MALILHTFESFNPKKVELALRELRVPAEVRTVDLYRRENRSPAFLTLNPRGKLPVLEVDGASIVESHAILAWIGETYGLWPTTAHGRAEALSWLFFFTGHLEEDLGNAWFQAWVLPRMGRAGDDALVTRSHEAVARQLAFVEARLTNRAWLLDELTLVDLSLAVLLEALRGSGFDFSGFPRCQDLHEAVRSRPAWAEAGIGYPPR